MKFTALCVAFALALSPTFGFGQNAQEPEPFRLVYEGTEGPGKGKHVVLIAGD
jgi:hypothetical protein